jgi:hypothetical protein
VKNHQDRRVTLDEHLVELLRAHRARSECDAAALDTTVQRDGFVFSPAPDCSERTRPDTVTQRYGRLAKRLGIDTHLHRLRHYSATELIAAGVDVRTVAGRLGHAGGGSTTLRIYTAFVAEAVVRAVAEAVHPPGVSRADLEAVVDVLVDAIRESASADRIARQVEERAPMFAQLGRFIRTPGGVVAILSVLLAVLALVRDVAADAAPQEPPVVTVEVDVPTEEVERIVEERLRELGGSGEAPPGADDAPPKASPSMPQQDHE